MSFSSSGMTSIRLLRRHHSSVGLCGMRHEQVYTELEAVLCKVIRVAVECLSVQDLISSAVRETNRARARAHTR